MARGADTTTRNMQAELLAAGVTLSERNIKRHAPYWRAEARRASLEAQQAAD